MMVRLVLACVAFCGLAVSARADGATAPTLPMLALNPQLDPQAVAPSPSFWSGLYVGSDVFAVSGGKGSKGGFGGGGYAGYNHEFANNLVVGVEAGAGYAPSLYRHGSVVGYDYASTNVKIGYDMGRLMPYMTMGVALAKPDVVAHNGFTTTTDAVNDLFNTSSNPKAFTSVGAGVDYAFTNNLSMGISVSVGSGRGAFAPFAAP